MESYQNTEIYQLRKELSFCSYLNFQIPITMKFYGVNLLYFKLIFFDPTEFII